MISTIGSKRVMMGSDLIRNIPVEVAKYKALDLNPDVWAQVMGQTAIDVFRLPM
jgi:predicted TIM-barrel fold metal-dependent hydrolase